MKKINFIVAVYNESFSEEAIAFINDLKVPEGYETDILVVRDTSSIADAYNEALDFSDADINIFVDENIYISDREFLINALEILESDNKIGCLGVLGYSGENFTEAGVWNIGSIVCNRGDYADCVQFQTSDELTEANVLFDGIVISRAYGRWIKNDLFVCGADSIGFCQDVINSGAKVVVSNQLGMGCYFNRDVKLNRYTDETYSQYEAICNQLSGYANQNAFEEIVPTCEMLRNNADASFNIKELLNYVEIYCLEKESNSGELSWYFNCEFGYRDILAKARAILLQMSVCQIGFNELKQQWDDLDFSDDFARWVGATVFPEKNNVICRLLHNNVQPLVSVILTNYNGADVISESIEAVLNQTYKNLEIILVDDCSPDNSVEIMNKYTGDSRVQVLVMEKNRHVCYASNEAIKLVTGKYTALVSYDDVWELDKIEKQVAFLEQHNEAIAVFSWCNIIDGYGKQINDRILETYNAFHAPNYPHKNLVKLFTYGGNFVCAPSACLRTDMLRKVGFFRYGLVQLQDFDLWFRLSQYGKMYFYPEKLVRYRRFMDNDRNVSVVNEGTKIRSIHERNYIVDDIIWNSPADYIIENFKDEFRCSDSITDEEIDCERIFILMKARCTFAEKHIIDMFESEEYRKLLEDKYSFSLLDFYKWNTFAIANLL